MLDRRATLTGLAAVPILATTAASDRNTGGLGTLLSHYNVPRIRQHHTVMNSGDFAWAAQFFAPDAKNHGRQVGRDGVLMVLTDIFRTFPDWQMDIEHIIVGGGSNNEVVARMMVSGTHKGVGRLPVNGGMLVGVEPTGKRFSVQHIHWYTMREGLIAEHRANRDDIGMMRQLGLLPPAPPMPAPPA